MRITNLRAGDNRFRFQRSLDLFKRQANHIAVAAFDMRDRVKSFVLDGVSAGFVKWIAAV